MKKKIFVVVMLLAIMMTNCTSPLIGTFTTTTDGVVYEYEIIVPMTNFVRLKTVTSPTPLTGEVTIPSAVSHGDIIYAVSQIGESVFENCTGITKVTLPSTISVIEEKAFKGCTALQEINTPQPLSSIGDYAFDGCIALDDVSLNASISTMGAGCFRNCSSLSEIVLPTTLNNLPTKAFQGCTSLSSIYIDRNMLSIGSQAFDGCAAVTAFTCLTPTPPTCDSNTFNGMNPNLTINVPAANVYQYRAATGWNYFTNFNGIN